MRKLYWTIGVIVLLQIVPLFLLYIVKPLGFVWIFIGAIYHLPLQWIGEPLFRATEIGPLPTILGRLAMTATYIVIAVVIWVLIHRRRES